MVKNKQLTEDIKSFMRVRQDRVYSADLKIISKDYSQADEESEQIFKNLTVNMPGYEKQLAEFLYTRMRMETYSNEVFYKRGFSDAIMILLMVC